MTPRWYVLRVMTGRETEVTAKVMDRAALALTPIRVLTERRRGEWRKVHRTMFPGYVFVLADLNVELYYDLLAIPNVIRFLRAGNGAPIPVPDDQMQSVITLSNGGHEFGISQGYRSNGVTCIRDGPLKRLTSHIVRVDTRRRRATVAIPILDDIKLVELGIDLKDSFAPAPADASPCTATSDQT